MFGWRRMYQEEKLTIATDKPDYVPGSRVLRQRYTRTRGIEQLSYRANISSRYCGTGVRNLQKFRAVMNMLYPYTGYCDTGVHNIHTFRVRLLNIAHNLQKFRVRVYMSLKQLTEVQGTGINVLHRTHRSSGCTGNTPRFASSSLLAQ